jgi:radical SAM protein with 4Fe4S-binding SPASM domain
VSNIDLLCDLFNAITISIDSHLESVADMLRGKGTFCSVQKVMKLLANSRIKNWSANVVLTKYNIDTYEETYEWLLFHGCPHVSPIIQTVRNEVKPDSYPSLPQIEQFLDNRYKSILFSENRHDIEADLASSRSYKISQKVACTAASSECAIDPSGYIYPCRMLMHRELRSMDNLVDKDFTSIWKDDSTLQLVRDGLPLPDECETCAYYNLCAGECHGHRLLATGEIMQNTSTEMCTIIKQIIINKIVANIHFAQKEATNDK